MGGSVQIVLSKVQIHAPSERGRLNLCIHPCATPRALVEPPELPFNALGRIRAPTVIVAFCRNARGPSRCHELTRGGDRRLASAGRVKHDYHLEMLTPLSPSKDKGVATRALALDLRANRMQVDGLLSGSLATFPNGLGRENARPFLPYLRMAKRPPVQSRETSEHCNGPGRVVASSSRPPERTGSSGDEEDPEDAGAADHLQRPRLGKIPRLSSDCVLLKTSANVRFTSSEISPQALSHSGCDP